MNTMKQQSLLYYFIIALLINPSYGYYIDQHGIYSSKYNNKRMRGNGATPEIKFQSSSSMSESSIDSVSNTGEHYLANSVECGVDQAKVTIKILTDDYPDQSSWTVVDSNNDLIKKSDSFSVENQVYKDNFCLQSGSFTFVMNDNWGDGMCPNWTNVSKYCGSYEVKINGIVAGSGSSFGYKQKRLFTVCTLDDQCNDNNECTADSCHKNLCIYEKLECSECGGNNVEVSIKTDDWAYQTTWELRNVNTGSIFYSGGAYNEAGVVFVENYCAPQGSHEFAIYDSYGDGICPPWSSECGYYKVSVNNADAVSGSAFSAKQVKEFTLCESDDQCSDDNPCTIDSCQNNTCTNEDLPCSECDGRNITVSIKTDDRPHQSTWDVRLDESDIKLRSGGAYPERGNIYTESFCLTTGKYVFNVFDYWGDGLCRDDVTTSSCGYYELKIDDAVIIKGGQGHWVNVTKEFIICSLDSDCDDSNPCTNDICNLESNTCEHATVRSQDCGVFGNKTALAIRLNALDSNVSASLNDISDSMFGTGENNSMSSLFATCSYDVFNIIPFSGKTITGVEIFQGVFEIDVDEKVHGESAQTVADKALTIADEVLGSIQDQFDYVLICLPPGTQTGSYDWKGYAFFNSYLSVYNDMNCVDLSVLMQEIGHNNGLGYANDDELHGDLTGWMGSTSSETNKCFNAAMSYKLGWYADTNHIVDVKELKKDTAYWYGLVGISDYNKQEKWMSTIIKVINTNDGYDYYVSFNSNSDTNSGSLEGVDKVLITRKQTGYTDADSFLVGTLDSSQRFQLIGENLNIYPYPQLDTFPPYAGILISSYPSQENCLEDESLLSLQLKTGEFPSGIVWTVENIDADKIMLSSGYYKDPNTWHTSSSCIPKGHYKFSMLSTEKNTSSLYSEYKITAGDVVVDQGNTSEWSSIDAYFVTCYWDIDCNDYDGCTFDQCKGGLCSNIPFDDCINCRSVSVDIKLDAYPDETTWGLYLHGTNIELISGDPYSLQRISNGRGKKGGRT